MPRANTTYILAGDATADYQQQFAVDTNQILVFEKTCVACLISVRGAAGTFVSISVDGGAAPSATNGLQIPAGAAPFLLPVGYHANTNHNLQMIGLTAGLFVDVLQLA